MRDFELRRPTTVEEALELLAAGGTPYCGGTELLAVMRMGLAEPEMLVDLKRIPELAGVDDRDGVLVLNARATHDEVSAHPAVLQEAPILAAATRALGNARVRATGTLAGNVCFAEPRSDVLTVLTALAATVHLRSAEARRDVPIAEFVEGTLTTVRGESELLVRMTLPKQQGRSSYVRFQPAEYPTVTVAVVEPESGGCRVVVGAVGDRAEVFEYDATEQVDAGAIAEAVDVTEDLNGQEDYKRHLTSVMVRRAVAALDGGASG
jgi:carbon-monoxide dehydrogenase medium subunit